MCFYINSLMLLLNQKKIPIKIFFDFMKFLQFHGKSDKVNKKSVFKGFNLSHKFAMGFFV